uniref:Uncharacterized protein n=1 Tax=Entomoneis paludosa TaxID=265537 RepID=A0A6U3BAK8_9STRA|mmetsp:Transcript_2998/g.6127  ORF Transcript_2998/g.6127 Transcript_2998/m.6127 type:complete len:124 (+) Transcript_2998:591-962(+)
MGGIHYISVPQIWTLDNQHAFGCQFNQVVGLLLPKYKKHLVENTGKKDNAQLPVTSSVRRVLSLLWVNRLSKEAMHVWHQLPDECILLVIQMCRSDWFRDSPDIIRQKRRPHQNPKRYPGAPM